MIAEQRKSIEVNEEFKTRRRRLPHWEQLGSAYFVTFKTAEPFVLSDQAKDVVLGAVKFHAGKKYRLDAVVVMETHVHLVMEPLEQEGGTLCSLEEIMRSVKGYTANRIQKLSGNRGSVWLAESYDRIVRDEVEYQEKLNYIINNPVKAGIVGKSEDYRWLYYEGQAAG